MTPTLTLFLSTDSLYESGVRSDLTKEIDPVRKNDLRWVGSLRVIVSREGVSGDGLYWREFEDKRKSKHGISMNRELWT